MMEDCVKRDPGAVLKLPYDTHGWRCPKCGAGLEKLAADPDEFFSDKDVCHTICTNCKHRDKINAFRISVQIQGAT